MISPKDQFSKLALFVSASLLFALAAPASAFAEEFAKYTTEQQELNEQGVRAIISKDYALAVAVLEESAALGELNVTYLNLGRAYQKLGDCKAAREAYDKAKTAPKVEAPAPRVVEKKVDEYAVELSEECSEEDSQLAEASAASGADQSPAAEPAPAKETSALEPAPSQPAPSQSAPSQPAPSQQEASSPTWAWVTTGSGIALMGAGVGALLWADSLRSEVHDAPRQGEYVTGVTRQQALDNASQAQTLDAVGIGMGVGGALLTAGGIYMLFGSDTEASDGVTVNTSPNGVNVVWTQSF